MNRITCCHGVSELRSMVASPQTVIALTELKSASMYGMLMYCPGGEEGEGETEVQHHAQREEV
jgi:hypothetical protein